MMYVIQTLYCRFVGISYVLKFHVCSLCFMTSFCNDIFIICQQLHQLSGLSIRKEKEKINNHIMTHLFVTTIDINDKKKYEEE